MAAPLSKHQRSFLHPSTDKDYRTRVLWDRNGVKIGQTDARDLAARMLATGLVKPPGWKSPEQLAVEEKNRAVYRRYRRAYQTACMGRLRGQRRGKLDAGPLTPRRLLREQSTGHWLSRAGTFSPDISEAIEFRSFTAAVAHCTESKLSGLELVVMFADARHDLACPVAVL